MRQTLRDVHRAGVLHGDIKVDNLSFEGGRPRICGFSKSRFDPSMTQKQAEMEIFDELLDEYSLLERTRTLTLLEPMGSASAA